MVAVCGLLIAAASPVTERRLQARAGLGVAAHGSAVVAQQGLSCPKACGVLPDQGSNPRLLPWPVYSLPLSHQGSPWKLL